MLFSSISHRATTFSVAVALWKHVVGYEEKDPEVVDRVREILERAKKEIGELRRA